MKKIINYLIIILIIFIIEISVYASNNITYIKLDDFTISNDNKNFENLQTYESFDEFLIDYQNNDLNDVYLTKFLFDGVGEVKTPDLDDFIENGSNDTKIKKLEINVLNIKNIGNYEITGNSKGTMIAINTNGLRGDINLILNNVKLDTDSKKAPVIYVYNKDITYTDCKVTIKSEKDSKNYLEGGKLKKVSLLNSEKLDEYQNNYTNDNLTNYNKYSSYYGIYNGEEIKNILFATVKADGEDLSEGDPLYFYKASGAISSDIDLYFEGNGFLSVTSKNKEGIETKGNMTFTGGTGDYEIFAQDDCLNTTTANSVGENVRNDLTINVNSLLAIVDDEGDEGDAIDSNGKLIINGGTIYAFAHSSSADAGLDSETGTYIYGGTIIATGNMTDRLAVDSKQNSIYVSFNKKISKDTLIVIKDEKDNIITAFKTSKDITSLLYSDKDLSNKAFKIYTNGTIDGEETNGLYTKINDYTNGEEIKYSLISNNYNKKHKNFILTMLIIEIILLAITCIIGKILLKRKNI